MATVSFSFTTGTIPERQQPFQSAVRVAVVTAAVQVVCGQQHLTDAEPVAGERRRVPLGEQQLPDARGRLLGGEITRTRLEAERADAGSDRTGGHQHHLLTGS